MRFIWHVSKTLVGLSVAGSVFAQGVAPGFLAGGARDSLGVESAPAANGSPAATITSIGGAVDGGGLATPRIVNTDAATAVGLGGRGKNAVQTPAAQRMLTTGPAAATVAPNEFQKFVREATGKLLPIFGAEFFLSETGYLPQTSSPVSGDYVLGPGDEVQIRGAGAIDVDYRAVIDRNGLINIPKVGTVSLVGVRAANAEEVIRGALGKVFRGFTLNVTLGQLRGITVYVVGQARRPGTYTLSSLSTLVSALYETGGPNPNGSMRRVQVKRAGRLVGEVDLYSFLAHGDKAADIRLIDGDVIVIPPAHGFVALTGKVENPAVFEIKGESDSIRSLLDVAGGLPVVAYPNRAFIERIDPERQRPLKVEEFSLNEAGLSKPLRRGDLLTVLPIRPEFDNAVTLQGAVSQALRVPYHEGMRITDLIPNKEFLLSSFAARRQNMLLTTRQRSAADPYLDKTEETKGLDAAPKLSPVDQIGNKYDELNWDYALVARMNRADMTERLIPFNLGRALASPGGSDNLVLQPGDSVSVFSADDVRIPIAKRKVFIRLEGEVRRPGIYQVESGETLVNVLEKAGGLTEDAYLFGAEFNRESVKKVQQDNLEKYVIRLEQLAISESSRILANASSIGSEAAALAQSRMAAEKEARAQFLKRLRELKPTGRISLGIKPQETSFLRAPMFRLENGDRLIIPSRPDFVQVVGAVNAEAAMVWQPGRSVSDYLAQAGTTKYSDKDEVFVIRADGTVASNSERWITTVAGLEVQPGDVVVVPEKVDRETGWATVVRNMKDITQILANFGLAAAAINVLK